jgi:ABC-2 type transport system ATP-binding protein
MIELTNVAKSYNRGRIKAVDDLSLTVKPGEIFGFLGPNGAGKTTTIKMIVGLLRPDAGRIVVEGHDVATDGLAAKQVTTYVPDYPAVYERLTGLEYLNFMATSTACPRPSGSSGSAAGSRPSSWPRPSPIPSRAIPTA